MPRVSRSEALATARDRAEKKLIACEEAYARKSNLLDMRSTNLKNIAMQKRHKKTRKPKKPIPAVPKRAYKKRVKAPVVVDKSKGSAFQKAKMAKVRAAKKK